MSTTTNHDAAEAELAAGSRGARQAGASEALGKCLLSGAAGPGSEAAAMCPHMAAAKQAVVKRTAEQVELPGRQAFDPASQPERPREAPGP